MRSRYRLDGAKVGLLVPLVLVAASLSAAAWRHDPQPPGMIVDSAAVWVPSDQLGEMALIDGPSATLVTSVRVADRKSRLSSVQRGLTDYTLDQRTGALAKIDGTTRHVSFSTTSVESSDTSSAARLIGATNDLFVHRADEGMLERIDVNTMERIGQQDAAPDGGDVDHVETAGGEVWAMGRKTGVVVRMSDGLRLRSGSEPGLKNDRLVDAGKVPALVDLESGTVTWFEDDGSQRSQMTAQPLTASASVTADPRSGTVYVLDPAVGLLICAPGGESCVKSAIPQSVSTSLGTAAFVQGRVLVPNYGTGEVWIFSSNPESGNTAEPIRAKLFGSESTFDLSTRTGTIFFNQPSTNQAGVLELDGTFRRVLKYNAPPDTPGRTEIRTKNPAPNHTSSRPEPSATQPESPTATRPPRPTSLTTRPTGRPTGKPKPVPDPTKTTPKSKITTKTKKPKPAPTKTEAPPVRSEGTIRQRSGSEVKGCATFSGTATLAPGTTLVTVHKNLRNEDPDVYVQYVFDWDDPESLSTWSGEQYFNEASLGQEFEIRLVAVDLEEAREANEDHEAEMAMVNRGRELDSITVTHTEMGGCG